ncbi:MAG: hydratase [Deltaproteobacteria bacterium]|nr:hydratase [Deltaproteobacteria bacterium]
MKQPDIGKMAFDQLEILAQARLVPPPSSRIPGFGMADAYAVAAEIVRLRRARGERTAGRKIGFTNLSTWARHGLDTPIWAHIYEGTVRFAANDAAALPLAGMALPRIEPEIVFGLAKAPAGNDERSMLAAVEWLALGFEVVDCHFPGWRFTPADGVVDFGLHAKLLIGTPLPVTGKNADKLIGQLKEFRVKLLCNGELKEEGVGENVLGSPLLSLRHLAQVIGNHTAEPLAPGETITTGMLTAAPDIRAGETWMAEVQGIDLSPLRLDLA